MLKLDYVGVQSYYHKHFSVSATIKDANILQVRSFSPINYALKRQLMLRESFFYYTLYVIEHPTFSLYPLVNVRTSRKLLTVIGGLEIAASIQCV